MECFSIELCVRGYYVYKEIWKVNVEEQIPYTRVNKRIRLFPKLQENMRFLPNMRLIMKAKLTTPTKLDRNASLV